MGPTQDRDLAFNLARTDPLAAAAVAERITEPWFRTQAFGAVVRYAAERDLDRYLDTARRAADAASDPYVRLGSAAWWLRALVERGRHQQAAREVSQLLTVVPTIPNPVNRIDALFLVLQAVFAVTESRRAVLDALVAAGQAAHSWKAGSRLRDAALMTHREQPSEAARVVAAMPDGKYKRQCLRRIEAGDHQEPRSFF